MSAIRYRKLDANDDYTFGRRDLFNFNVEAVAQAVKTRLLHLRGEWWENILDGTPLFQEVMGQFFTAESVSEIDLVFSERITGTQGVTEITEFDSRVNLQTRTYSASIRIDTIFGEQFTIDITGAGGGILDVALQGGG